MNTSPVKINAVPAPYERRSLIVEHLANSIDESIKDLTDAVIGLENAVEILGMPRLCEGPASEEKGAAATAGVIPDFLASFAVSISALASRVRGIQSRLEV